MSKKEMLESVIADYKAHREMAKEIHILYANGTKAGIGNKEVIMKVMDTLIDEAESQFHELTSGVEKCSNYVPKDEKKGWRKYPAEKPLVTGEYLVRGIGGLNNALHHWVCLWVGKCEGPSIENRFFYGGNEFQNVPSGEFEWMDLKEL